MSLTAIDISHQYNITDRPVLENVTVRIEDGESVALLGPSGSGKSTLLGILGLLHTPSAGDVAVDDITVTTDRSAIHALRSDMGWVLQGSNLLGRRTALDNVVLTLLAKGISRTDAEPTATELLQRVGLGHRINTPVRLLSGGEAQRVSIARAFLSQPRWVLADEPTGQLDHATTNDIINAVLEARSATTSLIVATHDHRLAERCDRVFEIIDGHLVSK